MSIVIRGAADEEVTTQAGARQARGGCPHTAAQSYRLTYGYGRIPGVIDVAVRRLARMSFDAALGGVGGDR